MGHPFRNVNLPNSSPLSGLYARVVFICLDFCENLDTNTAINTSRNTITPTIIPILMAPKENKKVVTSHSKMLFKCFNFYCVISRAKTALIWFQP